MRLIPGGLLIRPLSGDMIVVPTASGDNLKPYGFIVSTETAQAYSSAVIRQSRAGCSNHA
jgi:hypothetical protein